ncbi:hypothetical protein GWK91_15600 [Virgibacillus sp. MSP4-1]|uniref:hypothetical protein n=1 Tax=Virgibacillus sp. MSP4-1 TaxID=2700081 RepID=UPI00039D26C6|nr:hypothetical protein [Virgibacillus sp. MSP4-1]QHS24232.1 hypothetical protein GWK91_15600 [Virgibacillus sp. MSP4-1]
MSNHVEWEVLQQYVKEQLPEEQQQNIEGHLSDCDVCFHQYMNVIDEWSIPFSVSDSFTDETMEKLAIVQPNQMKNKGNASSRDVRRKTLAHYFLAAGLTVLLMFSGVFDMLFSLDDQIEADDPPISEKILEANFLNTGNGKEEKGNE